MKFTLRLTEKIELVISHGLRRRGLLDNHFHRHRAIRRHRGRGLYQHFRHRRRDQRARGLPAGLDGPAAMPLFVIGNINVLVNIRDVALHFAAAYAAQLFIRHKAFLAHAAQLNAIDQTHQAVLVIDSRAVCRSSGS